MNKLRDKIISGLKTKNMKNGSYSILFSVAVIAIAIIINLIVGEIPSQYTKFDLSDQKLYSVGSQTKKMVKALKDDVTIYYIAQNEESSSNDPALVGYIDKMLERYKDLSSRVKVVKKDPVLNPSFTAEYTQEEVLENSLIVVSGEKSKVLQFYSLFETQMNQQTGQEEIMGFDGEGQLTSAISYVTSKDLPVLYQTEGHGETALGASFTDLIEKENMELGSLNLLTEKEIPENAAGIVISAPTTDFSKEETKKVISYLENGGKAMIVSRYTSEKMTNFKSILDSYGVKTAEGIVLEGDAQHYVSKPNYLLPEYGQTDITADMATNNRNVVLISSQGIQLLEKYRDTLVIEPLLSTSDSAFSKINVETSTTYEKEKNDIAGPFHLGVTISEPVGENKQTQVVYYATETILDEQLNQQVSGGNAELFMNSLIWMSKGDESSSVSIASKSLQLSPLTLNQSDINLWTLVTLILIPGVFIIGGFVIWYRRRKK